MIAPGTVIPVGSRVSPAGERGQRGEDAGTGPIGSVLAYAGRLAPDGYLICDGEWYEVANYPDLYAVIGHDFTYEDRGEEWFQVPDLRARAPVGVGVLDGSTVAGPPNFHLGLKWGDYRMPTHSHVFNFDHYHGAIAINSHGHGDPSHQHYTDNMTVRYTYAGGAYHGHDVASAAVHHRATENPLSQAGWTGIQWAGNPGGSTNYVSQTIANWHLRTTDNAGAGTANNIPPSLGLNFIIKY